MEFRLSVGTLERSTVCSKTNVQSMQIVKNVEAQHVQFVLRTKTLEHSGLHQVLPNPAY